jgi:hypothetical protein
VPCGNFNNIVFPHGCWIAVLAMFLRNSEHGNWLNKQVLIGIFEVQCYNETSNVIIFTFKNQYISILRWVIGKPEDWIQWMSTHAESLKSVCTCFAKVWCLKQIVCSVLANHGAPLVYRWWITVHSIIYHITPLISHDIPLIHYP